MDWILTIIVLVVFGGLTAFAGWKSGRPRKDSLKAQWISWPFVTVLAATVAIFALIHAMSLLGYQTGGNVVGGYPGA